MSTSRFVDLDRFEGASSLTDLFATDALLDALGGRDASYGAVLGGPGQSGEADRAIFLLRALTESVDASLAHLGELGDLDVPAELDELGASAALLRFVPRDGALSCRAESGVGDPRRGSAFGRVARRAVPRHLPRANRLVAAAAGAMIVLSGGGLAAAATNSPDHGWGPLAPLSRVLHPGWTDTSVAAKRAVVVRELQQAVDQSRSGQKGAAAATYRAASRRASDLPSGPDATLRQQMAAVAQQLGLTDDPTTTVPLPADVTSPVTATDPAGLPTGGLTTAPPPPDSSPVAAPTAGAAPGALPPAPPADPVAPSGTEPGAEPVTDPAPSDPVPSDPAPSDPAPSDQAPTGGSLAPIDPPVPSLGAPVGGSTTDPSSATTDPSSTTTDPSSTTTDPTPPSTVVGAPPVSDPAAPPVSDPVAPPVVDPATPPSGTLVGHHHHHGRHRADHGQHRVGAAAPGSPTPAGTSSDQSAAPPADSTTDAVGVTSDTSTA